MRRGALYASVVFLTAFALNVGWENAHVVLYDNYKGGIITGFILARAALFDAAVITVFVLPLLLTTASRQKTWILLVVGIVIGTVNEWYGLSTARWAYNTMMPIVPFVEVGLSPMLQLGVLGFLSYHLTLFFTRR